MRGAGQRRDRCLGLDRALAAPGEPDGHGRQEITPQDRVLAGAFWVRGGLDNARQPAPVVELFPSLCNRSTPRATDPSLREGVRST